MCNELLLLPFSEFARRYPSDLRSFRIDWNVGIRCHDVTAFVRREIWGAPHPWRCRIQMPRPGIARYAATNICDSDYENRRRFDSTPFVAKGEVRATTVSMFLGAYLTPGLFPSKYPDYSSASHVFVLHRVRDTLSRAGKTEDGNLLFPHELRHVIYVRRFDSRGLRAYLGAARSYFHVTSRV